MKKKKKEKIRIANKRINKLFLLAEEKAKLNRLDLSDRYVEIARKIAMRYQISIPKKYKRFFCKHCYSYLLPGVTSRIRTNKNKLNIYCKKCFKYTRIPLKKQ